MISLRGLQEEMKLKADDRTL